MTDEQIKDCYHNNTGDCQTCPENARCLALFEQELARRLRHGAAGGGGMIELMQTNIKGVEVSHYPDDPPELIREIAEWFLGCIKYRQLHPKKPGEEGYEFWQHFMDIELSGEVEP